MFPTERKHKILDLLEEKKFITIKEICNNLYISQSTARRDLIKMENEKLIIRTHGGAKLPANSANEHSYTQREKQNKSKKIKIADMASTFIEDGISLFLDSSSTVQCVIPFLNGFKDLTIVTNGLQNALELSKIKNLNTIIIGGNLYPGSSSIVGASTSSALSNYKVDLSMLSCRGLDGNGIYEANEPQAVIKQKMIQNSNKKILLCDSSKFNNNFFYKLGDLDTFHYIITDDMPNNYIKNKIENSGSMIIEA